MTDQLKERFTKITEIVPDDAPAWVQDAMDEGRFFAVAIGRVAGLTAKVSQLEQAYTALVEGLRGLADEWHLEDSASCDQPDELAHELLCKRTNDLESFIEGEPYNPWRPMDTAPKDGTEVLLKVEHHPSTQKEHVVGHYMPGGHCIEDHPAIAEGWYYWNGSYFGPVSNPVKWMPIPIDHPPQEGESS